MKLLRIIIIALILLSLGAFIWFTAGTDARTLLFERIVDTDLRIVYPVLMLCFLTLLSTLSGLPILYLSMGLGFLMNFTPALLICWGVNVVSVMAAFLMVRALFSGYFRKKYGEKKLVKRVNKKIARYGLWTIVFSRSIYILPTNLINFGFPLSNISSRSYLIGTLVGIVPECLINVLTGYLIKHEVILLSSPESSTWQVLVVGGFIVLLLLLLMVLRVRQIRSRKLLKPGGVPYRE